MAAGSPRPSAAWSVEVERPPVRRSSDAELARLAERLGLGFSRAELGRIRAHYRSVGREPSDVELAGLSQSWSEHCSYKSSKLWLRAAFRGLTPRTRVLGTGDAGVLRLGPDLAYALRIESHNHPSAVEPYGGAATGIGGILRDVLAVGGRPIALADPLFFGPADGSAPPAGYLASTALLRGVVAGIRDYGNRVGVPTVSGSIAFDPAYATNPLVNVGCVGLLPRTRLMPNRARRAGDRAVLVGGLTGRDGIGGVSFASRGLDASSASSSRSNVQLGDPIMKEPLIRACLEAFDRRLVHGVKDLGGGGLATASGELAYAGGLGLAVDLDSVPLREPTMRPWEVWVSESQERMLLDAAAPDVPDLLELVRSYDVPATEIGEFVRGRTESLYWKGELAGQLPIAFRVDPPLLRRPRAAGRRRRTAAPSLPDEAADHLVEELLLDPSSLSREPVIRLYDHEVQGRTVLKPLQGRPTSPSHGDASVLRVSDDRPQGLAVAIASQPWACAVDARAGAVWTVEEAARNLYAVGARPDAFTDCLNFGNPERPEVMGSFVDATRGLADGARALGFAVPSGNVSFYNESPTTAIPPTPVLMATGLVEAIERVTSADLKEEGDPIYLLGRSDGALGGSLYARRRDLAELPMPPVRPREVRTLGERLLRAGAAGLLRAVHDVADGGLAVAACEMAWGGGLGFEIDLAATGLAPAWRASVAEGGSRWLVEVPAREERRFRRLFERAPLVRLGRVSDSAGRLSWNGSPVAELDLARLYERWRSGLSL